MSFVPFPGKIEFEPLKEKNVILSDEDSVVEAGKVIQVGEGVDFVNPGDTIFFLRYGAECTPEIDGKKHWTLEIDRSFIMGKYV